MVFCFCAFVKSVPPFSRMGLNCKEQFHLGVRPHCTDLPTQMLRSKVSRCMLPLPITIVIKNSAWKYWDDLPESSGTEQSKIPTGTLPLALGSVSIKLNDITCLIFLTTTLHNWGWQCISLKNLKYFIFLYNIVHQLNAKHLVVSFKIQIRLNSEATAISVTTHLTMYTRVTHTPNTYSFICRCIYIDMHLYTHTHSCKSPFPEPKGQDIVSKRTYLRNSLAVQWLGLGTFTAVARAGNWDPTSRTAWAKTKIKDIFWSCF